CVKDPDDYEITFYHDDAGAPGSVACGPYTLTPVKEEPIPGKGLYYHADLAPCCDLAEGWVSIVGIDQGQNCYFFWIESRVGDEAAWLEDLDDGTWYFEDEDLSLCLSGPHFTITPTTSWQTHGPVDVPAGGARVYEMYLEAGSAYDFSICDLDGVGGSANPGDGDLTMYDATGAELWYLDGPSGCGYDATTLGSAYETWSPPADGNYYLAVDEYYGDALTYTLAYRAYAPGDICATAIALSGPLPISTGGTTVGYTDDYDEACPDPATAADVVYAYTPTEDQLVNITLCGNDSITSYDTKLYVYEDACPDAEYFACNDDACSTSLASGVSQLPGLSLTAGHTYYIIVDGHGSAAGIHDLHIVLEPPCSEGSLFSQPPSLDSGTHHSPSDYGLGSSGWRAYENFWGVSEPICDVHWWGDAADDQSGSCIKDPDDFEITFYLDDGSDQPGPVACGPYTVTPLREDTGLGFYRYSADLASCCDLSQGWVSVVGIDYGEDCYFSWWESLIGDDAGWREDVEDGTMHASEFDVGLCLTGDCVGPGQDCWATDCGLGTQADFSDNPIPADFFDPGSEPFDGVIELGGATGGIDTIVERLDRMCFGTPYPSSDQVDVQLVQLDLVGCQFITVTGSGDWNVEVSLSDVQPTGTLTATKTHENGGYFEAAFYVQPVYTFTRVAPPNDMRVFDTAAEGLPPILMLTDAYAHWSTDESFDQCTQDGFAAGMHYDPDPSARCCPETCHSSFGTAPHQHCARPPGCPWCFYCLPLVDGSDCDDVVCPDPFDDCTPIRVRRAFAGPGFPPAGTDVIRFTSGQLEIEIPDSGVSVFTIQQDSNPTVVERQDPYCDGINPCTIQTEITSMELTASDGATTALVNMALSQASMGVIQGWDASSDYPASGIFDVFVNVDIPSLGAFGLYNETPIFIAADSFYTLPPWEAVFETPEVWDPVELFLDGSPTDYWIHSVQHVLPPPPPELQVVDCDCLDTDAAHVAFDAAGGTVWCEGLCPSGYQPRLYSADNPDGTTDYWCECACVCADIDHSGGPANLGDFATFAVCFGLSAPNPPDCDAAAFACSDMDASGTVELGDFATFAIWFGLETAQTVPNCEP
ncbi:MAG: hypothetical protein JSU68_01795, partial [Phycisphaerales bacterium]